MYSIIISCISIALVSLLCYTTLKYGIEIFHKNNIKIKFKVLNKNLIFKTPEISGKYQITIPCGFHIKKTMKLKYLSTLIEVI